MIVIYPTRSWVESWEFPSGEAADASFVLGEGSKGLTSFIVESLLSLAREVVISSDFSRPFNQGRGRDFPHRGFRGATLLHHALRSARNNFGPGSVIEVDNALRMRGWMITHLFSSLRKWSFQKKIRRDFGLYKSGSPFLLAPKRRRTKMINDLKLRTVQPKAGPSGRTRAKCVKSKVSSWGFSSRKRSLRREGDEWEVWLCFLWAAYVPELRDQIMM